MTEKQIRELLYACYVEFCAIVGDNPCVCDVCPYSKYNTDENEGGCYEAYVKDKLSKDEKGA